jgi:esterase/lipase superfamily enzyme
LALCLAAAWLTTAPAAGAESDSSGVAPIVPPGTVRVYFATDRTPTGSARLDRRFGDRWGDLTYGVCDIVVPPRSKRRGSEKTMRPFRTPGRPSKKVRLATIVTVPRDSFFESLAGGVPGDSSGTLVFVHGYNVRFETAARFAAQIGNDLGFRGRLLLYGWPSTPKYMADEESMEWTRTHLSELLAALASRSSGPVNLLGYSLGARVLARALAELSATPAHPGSPIFGEVVFVAPDVESRLFTRDLRQAMGSARRWTLYSSARDRALRMSQRLHGNRRAGEAGRHLVIVPGLETIDVSRINADILGHGYLEELVGDLHAVLVEHSPPESRRRITRVVRGDAVYWKLDRAK